MLECWDRKNKDYVAIKIVRNVQKYRDAAMIEVHSLPYQGTFIHLVSLQCLTEDTTSCLATLASIAASIWQYSDSPLDLQSGKTHPTGDCYGASLVHPSSTLCDVQLEVLNTLEKNDVTGQFHCVSLQEWFEYRGHVCMAFERLGLSLYDFLRRSGYLPFQVNLVGAQRSAQHAHIVASLYAAF